MIRRFLLLNGLATLGVVLNHAIPWGFIAMFWWTHRYLPVETPNFDQLGGGVYYGMRLIEQLIIFSIPTFLFVSGFFVSVGVGRTRRNVDRRLIGARLIYLIVPYLLWSHLIFGLNAAQAGVLGVNNYFVRLLTGGANDAYYFAPLLCQLYLLSFLLVPAARARPILLLAVTAVIQLTIQTIIYLDTWGQPVAPWLLTISRSWFFPSHIFWFTSGIVIGFNASAFQKWLPRLKWGALVIASNFQNPPERDYLTHLADDLGVELELLGNIDDETLRRLYNEAAVTAYTPHREPFGPVPVEAMACGAAVVAIREGGVPESVVHEETGLLAERDPALFGAALRRWTWDTTIERLETHFNAAAQNR